jgi:mRNA interferase MazF
MPPAKYVPERGDVVWLDFDPSVGHEQANRRPAVVLSRGVYNSRTGLAVVCPVTRRGKGYPSEITIPSGFPVSGVVLVDHMKNQDWAARRAVFVCRLDDELIRSILTVMNAFLS